MHCLTGVKGGEEDMAWLSMGFPTYMQSFSHNLDVCEDFDAAIRAAEWQQGASPEDMDDPFVPAVWHAIRWAPVLCRRRQQQQQQLVLLPGV